MKKQTYLLLILCAYIVGISIGLLCNTNSIFLLILIPTTYVLWRGHLIQQRIDKTFNDIENELKSQK